MINKAVYALFFLILISFQTFGQFGQNKVQYKSFEWYFIQTEHFDIYFSKDGKTTAEFASKAAEDALASISQNLNYRINNRIALILYYSQNDFQETNVTDEYLSEGIGGFTELFKNRVVLPYTGNYKMFRHVIHHELVHAVINDMFYGGSMQNVISNNISIRLPLWFNEGLAEYLSLGWDTNTDMFIRDAAINEYLPDIPNLSNYFAYRGGQAVFNYIAKKYGEQKVGELVNNIKSKGSLEDGLKTSIGLTLEELNERWKKDIKREFWPDISTRKDPDEFAKRLTDHRKDGGFYNTSPAISPQGDKIVFISNRDFYFDVYLMNAVDGKVIKRLVKGNRTADFEELNILTPGLSWSPDGNFIALSAKSSGYDVIYLIDVKEEDVEILPFKFDGIGSVSISPDGENIAFSGHNNTQSDIYIYNIHSRVVTNITNDIFTDSDPVWSPDAKKIVFASDRGEFTNSNQVDESFRIQNHNYSQNDLYYIVLETKSITRVTDYKYSDESSPVVSPDGKSILFISDLNGINNIYKKRIILDENDSVSSVVDIPAIPVTNSLNGVSQLSISLDGKKLSFSSMYQSAYNIFLLNNPFNIDLEKDSLELTLYMSKLRNPGTKKEIDSVKQEPIEEAENKTKNDFEIVTGAIIDTSKTYTDSSSVDFRNYVFGSKDIMQIDTTKIKNNNFNLTTNIDSSGNFVVNRYKINFSPDIVYANAGYNTMYGLLGTTVISFSDMLGNHRLIGLTSLQIDLKNSDYGLAYYYLPNRINYGIEGFHTARFLYLQRGPYLNIFRFRNYGLSLSASYPLSRYYRIDAGLSYLNVSAENLDNTNEETQKVNYIIPALSFVHDNTIFGYTAPIDGSRYRLDFISNPFVQTDRFGFYSILGDYRSYWRFWYDYSFAIRFSAGYSGGKNPQRFFLGGIENWINRSFATGEVPLETPQDFAFLTAALPMRGFNYAERIGSKYTLMNMEFRFPLIRYLLTGALPILFRDVLGVLFIDMGAAWNNNRQLKLFERNLNGNIVSKDLLMGTGYGARLYFLYFLLRFDMAYAYDGHSFSKPVFYFSIGADF
ncbi:MAG: peptidase MA family metallohydrolase [Ignavibacteria bacterium]|nr:peptidase MA family metallohydrolase [Ignavibacteria bacterium]